MLEVQLKNNKNMYRNNLFSINILACANLISTLKVVGMSQSCINNVAVMSWCHGIIIDFEQSLIVTAQLH